MGRDITHTPIYKRVSMGFGAVFPGSERFSPDCRSFENVEIPVLALKGRASRFFLPLSREEEAAGSQRGAGNGGFGSGGGVASASELSHGDQRLLEIGIALASKPRLLFLDEPTAGMNPVERVKILQNIRTLSQKGGRPLL